MLIGIVTDLTSVQGPLFVCERTALDSLMTSLVEQCHCGHIPWEARSYKQVE